MPTLKFPAVVSSLALVATAFIAGGATTSSAHAATEAAAPVAVSISGTRRITMPTTVQPGVTEFEVTSAKSSGFQLLSLADGYTVDDAEADIKQGLDRGKLSALRRFERKTMLVGGVASVPDRPTSFWVDLEPGTYVALDTQGRTNASKWVSFTAAGADTGASMPSGATVKAVRSASWSKKPGSIPHKGTLTFKNRSDQNHFLIMVKMRKGATIADVKEFLMTEAGPPPVDFRTSLDSAVISPGHTVAFDYKLPRGTYAMLCFWPDASMRGMPHALMGMARTIRLT